MPIKVIQTSVANDIALDLQNGNSPLSQAILPDYAQATASQFTFSWFFMAFDLLTETGLEPRRALTTVFTDSKPAYLLPSPIPAPLMCQSQARFERIVSEAASLTGHQRLDLHEDIASANASPIVVPHPGLRGIADRSETWRWLNRGMAIAATLKTELAAFDAALPHYNPSVGSRPVLGLVSALGHQASLAQYLEASGAKAGDWAGIAAMIKTRDPGLAVAREHCERLVEAETSAMGALELFRPVRYRGISSSIAQEIHEILFPNYLNGRLGQFREHDSGFDPETGLLGLPCKSFGLQTRHFNRLCFQTFPDLHGIVRAGLALLQFLRMRLFEDGNGDVARILLELLLAERGIPELPLDLVFARQAEAFRNAVQTAIFDRDILQFIRLLVGVCHGAIRKGQEIAIAVQAEILRLRHAMARMNTGAVDTNHLALALCSRLIVEDHQVIFACDADPQAPIALARELAAAGLIDEVEVDGKVFWSLQGIRKILSDSSQAADS